MRIVIGYPPLESEKGTPLLSQNRQFQWFRKPTYIYPLIPAYAATLLKKTGHQVFWLDGIAEKWRYQHWFDEVQKIRPDLIMIETKTPVIKKHWRIIDHLKSQISKLKTVLVGDHVTALPKESFQNSKVDYVLTGGDYDFLLLNLVNHLSRGEKLEPGIWYREKLKMTTKNQKIWNTGEFRLNHDLNSLPFIDRDLTRWWLYAYENGNYKYLPGTYIMSGRDCWWRKNGGCTFCSWTSLYPSWRVRKVANVLDEMGELIEKHQVKEIMDDSGTFPQGEWLREFCRGMIKRGYQQKICFDCNLRFGVLSKRDYQLMAKAGFRLLLYGLESANQETIDRLNKGIKIDAVEKELKMVKEANKEVGGSLEPHLTFMVGYPWEKKKEAQKTVAMARYLFAQGLIDSLQATIVIPYPGTKLFAEAKKRGWLQTEDWNDYDMSKPVLKTVLEPKEIKRLVRQLYCSFLTPRFLLSRLASLRSVDDFKFFWRAGKAVLGHLVDFSQ